MNRKLRTLSAAALLAAALIVPASAARVEINGTALSPGQGWVEDGASRVTLLSLSQSAQYDLSWDGAAAALSGPGFTLTAAPGQEYIQVNGRFLYVPGGVQCRDGRTVLPLALLADALGCPLTWEAASGTAALNTALAAPKTADYDGEDLYWLARIISAESRGEPLAGQIAVGNVVLNRVKSSSFPNSVKEVVFDDRYAIQFEPVANGTVYDRPTESALLAAKLCLEGASTAGDSLYFFAPALSAGSWIRSSRTYYTTIGCHRFYL